MTMGFLFCYFIRNFRIEILYKLQVGEIMIKKSNIKSRISDTLELPKEVTLNIPVLKITGKNDLFIENHKGIVEYSKEILRINSEIGIIKISGRDLLIKEISREEILIAGDVNTIEFIS